MTARSSRLTSHPTSHLTPNLGARRIPPRGTRIAHAALAAALLISAACGDPSLDETDASSGSNTGTASSALGGTGGQVHGFAAIQPPGSATTIRRAGLAVMLKNPSTGVQVGPTVTTDVHGRYDLPAVPPANYNLCISGAGVTTSCALITLTAQTYNVPGERVLTPTGGVVWGKVRLADGKPCFHENPGMGLPLTTTAVQLLTTGGSNVVPPVVANDRGEYLFSGITASGAYTVRATCTVTVATRAISFVLGQFRNPIDLTLPDRSPIPVSIIARVGGVPVRSVLPGTIVQVTVTAHDPDGHPLHYTWADGANSLTSVDAATINWQVPSVDATALIFVDISDGKGGFAAANLALPMKKLRPLFTGIAVRGATSAPIANARIRVNGGKPVTTDALGRFELRADEADRYTITATAPRQAMASRIYYGPATGVVLSLADTERTLCDPNKACVIRSSNQEQPVQVTLQPGSIVRKSDGRPATAPVFVDVANIDLARANSMPGDFSAVDREGRAVPLISNGAVSVDIIDGEDQRYTIAQGKTARLSIPVDPRVLAAGPPAQIPLWEYNEDSGLWEEKALAVYNPQTRTFDGDVPGFSTWNADITFTGDACIRLGLDPARTPPFPFVLHVSVPMTSGPPRTFDFTVTEAVNGIFRLPPNTAVTLEIHPGSGPDAILDTMIVDSGPPIDPSYGGFPPFDFSACHGFDPASALPGQPVLLGLDLPSHSSQWLSRPGTGSDVESADYYNTVAGVTVNPTTGVCTPPGSGPNRCTLPGFLAANGFATNYDTTWIPAPGEVVTYFYNNGDLGLGREMHCKQTGANLACYVTNYGLSFPPAAEPVSAIAAAIAHAGPIATVAMEYDASKPVDERVSFYAYPAGASLALKVPLDTEGPKNIPQMCMACHGGSYDDINHKAMGSVFREFDVYSYLYDTGVWTLANQQQNFRQLNAMVKATNPNSANPNDPIRTLIDRMYDTCGGVNTPGCTADTNDRPAAWNGSAHDQGLYDQIVKPYCRACHVAQSSSLDWATPGPFTAGLIGFAVCTSHDMPHAEHPFRKFWFSTNPAAPVFLADPTVGLGIVGGCPR